MHACRPDGEKKTKCNKKFLCPLIFPVPAGAQKQNMQHVQSGVRNITRPAGGSFAQRAMRAWCSSIVFERLPAHPVVIVAERLICCSDEHPGVFYHHALRVGLREKQRTARMLRWIVQGMAPRADKWQGWPQKSSQSVPLQPIVVKPRCPASHSRVRVASVSRRSAAVVVVVAARLVGGRWRSGSGSHHGVV